MIEEDLPQRTFENFLRANGRNRSGSGKASINIDVRGARNEGVFRVIFDLRLTNGMHKINKTLLEKERLYATPLYEPWYRRQESQTTSNLHPSSAEKQL